MAGRMMDQRRQGVQREDAGSHGVRCIVLGSIAGRRCAFDRESLSDALVRYCSRVLTRVAPRAMTQYEGERSGKCAVRGPRAMPRARATPVFRTRPLSSRERPRETRAAPRGARGEAGRKRTRTRPHTERGHTQTAERCAGSAGAVPWRRGSIMRGCWSACLWDRGASGRRTVRSTTGRVTTCSIA